MGSSDKGKSIIFALSLWVIEKEGNKMVHCLYNTKAQVVWLGRRKKKRKVVGRVYYHTISNGNKVEMSVGWRKEEAMW